MKFQQQLYRYIRHKKRSGINNIHLPALTFPIQFSDFIEVDRTMIHMPAMLACSWRPGINCIWPSAGPEISAELHNGPEVRYTAFARQPNLALHAATLRYVTSNALTHGELLVCCPLLNHRQKRSINQINKDDKWMCYAEYGSRICQSRKM